MNINNFPVRCYFQPNLDDPSTIVWGEAVRFEWGLALFVADEPNEDWPEHGEWLEFEDSFADFVRVAGHSVQPDGHTHEPTTLESYLAAKHPTYVPVYIHTPNLTFGQCN